MNNQFEDGHGSSPPHSFFSLKTLGIFILVVLLIGMGIQIYGFQLIPWNATRNPRQKPDANPIRISVAPQAGLTSRPQVEIQRTRPWIEPRIETDMLRPFTVGSIVPVTVYAYSGGADVTGYDVLLSYDPNQFELVISKSLLDQYQTYQFDRGTHIAITGIKQLEEKNPFQFDNTPIIQVQLKVKKVGNAHISIASQVKSAKTQFVDSSVVVTTPQVGAVDFTIQ